jgi:predicted DNA-binding transcriptional regulator AlpA
MRWPALMLKKTLLEYLEIGEESLYREIDAGRLPSAVMIGGRQHWHRDAVDEALKRIAGGQATDLVQQMRDKIRKAA